MQQTQKSAAKAEAQRHRGILFVDQGGVVQLEFFETGGQVSVPIRRNGVDGGEHHRFGFPETRHGGSAGAFLQGDGIPAAGVADGFDSGDHIPHLPGRQLFPGFPLHLEHADLLDLVCRLIGHECDGLPGMDFSLKDPKVDDGSPERVIIAVEYQGFQSGIGISHRRRQIVDHPFQDLIDTRSLLCGGQNRLFRVKPQVGFDLCPDPIHIRRRQIDLVDDGDDFKVMLHGEIQVRQSLGLYTLAGVDQEQCAFTGGQGPGYFIGKVHMARGVDEVQRVVFSIPGPVGQADGLAFDGDPSFPFNLHGIEDLVFEIPVGHHMGGLDHSIGQGGLAVIDVCDNAEVSDMFHRMFESIAGLTRCRIPIMLRP